MMVQVHSHLPIYISRMNIMRLLKKRIIDPKKLYGTSTWQRLSAHFKTADSEEHYTIMVDARNDGRHSEYVLWLSDDEMDKMEEI